MNKIIRYTLALPLVVLFALPFAAHAASLSITSSPTVLTSASIKTGTTASSTTGPVTINGQLSSKAVSSDTDLTAYTNAVVSADMSSNTSDTINDNAQIKNVTYQSNGVTVDFTQPAKFLGLFPTSVSAQAVVQADGTVAINYPWYSFLIRKHKDAITTIFQTQVTQATSGKAVLSADASASVAPQTKAIFLDAIRQAIHGLRTKASVQSTTSASATAK